MPVKTDNGTTAQFASDTVPSKINEANHGTFVTIGLRNVKIKVNLMCIGTLVKIIWPIIIPSITVLHITEMWDKNIYSSKIFTHKINRGKLSPISFPYFCYPALRGCADDHTDVVTVTKYDARTTMDGRIEQSIKTVRINSEQSHKISNQTFLSTLLQKCLPKVTEK